MASVAKTKKRYFWWILVACVAATGAYYFFYMDKKQSNSDLIVKVEQGDFEVLITVTGELQAKFFESIMGPDMRSGVFRINELRIQDLVDEGTIVNAGDYIAELDRSAANNVLRDHEERIDRQEVQCETVRMDTTLNLRGLRDDLLNREFGLEELRLRLEQSIYEPPATIRQIEIELERAHRALEQQRRLYALREQHYKNWIYDVERTLNLMNRQHEQMVEILKGFTVRAPRNGMVIYRRERNGQKRRTGSTMSIWDNVIATLPDLSTMISKTYVNEIDISKVKIGQEVRIGVDAFPDRNFTGIITAVADIGEQLANTDAKVFEVLIEVNESDPIMRPPMTTSNTIVVSAKTNVNYISIDAIYSQDSIPFVYTANHTKQVVVLGEANENEIIVEQGLSSGDQVYLNIPENSKNWNMAGEELIVIIKQRALEKKREQEELERRAREESRNERNRNQQRQGGRR